MGANPADTKFGLIRPKRFQLSVQITPPISIVNRPTVALYNKYFYWKHARLANTSVVQSLDQYLYPLDSISNWNRIYGPKGFHQYQCVVPESNQKLAIEELLSEISSSGSGSFLAVLKSFGDAQSPGWLSFPMLGTTLAVDFPHSNKLSRLFDRMDAIVLNAGGRIYPAKDSHMSAAFFKQSYPHWERLEAVRDKKLNSMFWQRVSK